MRSKFIALWFAASTTFTAIAAAEEQRNSLPNHWIMQHFQDMQAAWPKHGENLKGPVRFVFGNNIWQPGHQFKDGNNWLALACGDKGCSIEPASLKVSDESWQGHYDDEATFGQRLLFNKQGDSSTGNVIAWFQTSTVQRWLKPGFISTYYTTDGQLKPPSGKGTLEIEIDLPSGKSAQLVPMLLTAELSSKLSRQYTPQTPRNSASFLLQLRANGKRQLMLGELGSCSHELNRDYLLWAGDMDQDGKADYLVSFIDADGPVHLYLSSAARKHQLVGLAGVHYAPPFGGECDGEGWL